MAGLGVLGILFGAVVAWSGYNDVSAFSVIKAALSGSPIPRYDQGAGARKVLAEVLGFELAKSAAQGLSSLLGLRGATGGGGAGEKGAAGDKAKGAAGEGAKPGEGPAPAEGAKPGEAPVPEPAPVEPIIPDIPLPVGFMSPNPTDTSHQGTVLL